MVVEEYGMTRHDRLTDRELRRLAQSDPAPDVAKMIGCGIVVVSSIATMIVMAAGAVAIVRWML
jgi:hypothetical protein